MEPTPNIVTDQIDMQELYKARTTANSILRQMDAASSETSMSEEVKVTAVVVPKSLKILQSYEKL